MSQLDIFMVVKSRLDTIKYIHKVPKKYLHPKNETNFLKFNMNNNVPLELIKLYNEIFKYDNDIAFCYLCKRFGMSIDKSSCENLVKKIIQYNSENIMKILIEMGINTQQADHLFLRYAKSLNIENNQMINILINSGADLNIEKSYEKFRNQKHYEKMK